MDGSVSAPLVARQAQGHNWTLFHGDCIDVTRGLPTDSLHYTIYSPPFESLFTFSDDPRDLSNCRDSETFWTHYRFLIAEIYRATMTGRLCSIHCMQLPTSKTRDGFIGLRDFRGEIIRAHQEAGFIFHSEVMIRKDPVVAMQRSKSIGLLHKQVCKDIHPARRLLLRLHRELIEAEEVAGTAQALHRQGAELRRWRRETIAARRAILEATGLGRWDIVRALWRLRRSLRDRRVLEWTDAPARGDDDGLHNLFLNEHLTWAEYAEGMSFRRLYVATEKSLRSAINFERAGAGDDKRKAEDWGAALVKRKELEALIMREFGANGRGLTTLRLIAGQGRTINAISKPNSGADRIKNREALKRALGVFVAHKAAMAEVGSAA